MLDAEKLIYYEKIINRYGKKIWLRCRFADIDSGGQTFADAVQDVSQTLWEILKRSSIEEFRANEEHLVKGVTKNIILRYLKKKKRYEPLTDSHQISGAVEEHDEETLIAELRAYLPPNDQKLLDLYLKGLSLEEIADNMGVQYAAARQQKSRMINKMKTIYKKLNNKG